MSRHTLSRMDRVAQMSIQEEIIAKKKLELIEKQKTVELAKKVVAAQSAVKSKKDKSNTTATAAAAASLPAVTARYLIATLTPHINCVTHYNNF